MIISAGALIKCSKTNRCFFVLRSKTSSFSSKWGLCGGKIHTDEKVLEGLTRELNEELGFMPEVEKWIVFNSFNSLDKKFCYHSILVLTPNEFIPNLNGENDGYCWVDLENPPKPLHPRLKEVLDSKILIESIKNFK